MNRYTDYLRVAALPLDIQRADKKSNIAAVETAFKNLPEYCDIVVLPELFSTGYIEDANMMKELAEPVQGPTINAIRHLAATHSVAIAGSFLAQDERRLCNRAFLIEPNSDETYYDKHHLFSLSDETNIFSRGERHIPVIRFRGWNVAMIICYDLRFPAWCRCRSNSYDILLVPANWPQARGYAWEHLLIARAIENQCCVVGANRGGSDKYGVYDNLTFIFDSHGMQTGTRHGPFVMADFSRQEQNDFRCRFPVANDADNFEFLP